MNLQIFSDRVEISNPGGLPSGLSKESFGHKSVTRNPLIADLLHRIGYIEKIGTGIKRIKDAIAETSNCSVEFKIDEHWFSTIFYRNKPNDISSDIRSNQIVKLLLKDNTLSATKIAAILNISSRGVEKQLARLKQDNVIIRQGSKKYGTWLVNTDKVLNDE
jgi:ATP-dependent DNA helicase RecG